MKKTLLILFVTLLLFASFILAQPPFQGTSTEFGQLEIVYPKVETYRVQPDLKLNFMVVNSSGYVLNASAGKVQCWFGLQNTSGDILIAGYSATSNYFFSPAVEANSTGLFSYEIHCNSTGGEFGYTSGYYYVTEHGHNYPPGNTGMSPLAVIAGVFAFCFLLLYIGFNVDTRKHHYLQLIILLFVVVMTVLIPKTLLDYVNDYNTAGIFYKGVNWFIRIFWTYVFFYVLYEFGRPLMENWRVRVK